MAEKEIIDVSIRLGGEWKKLQKLKSEGLSINVKLNFNKAKGGGFSQLEKFSQSGLNIDVRLNLKGMDKLEKLRKGFEIPVNIKTPTSKSSAGSNSSSFLKNMQRLEVQFNKTGAAKDRFIKNLQQLDSVFKELSASSRSARSGVSRLSNRAAGGTSAGRRGRSSLEEYMEREQDRLEDKYSTKNRRDEVDRQLKRLFREQALRPERERSENERVKLASQGFSSAAQRDAALAYGKAGAPSSNINQREIDAVNARRQQLYSQQSAERLRRSLRLDEERTFRNRYRRERAQEEFENLPFFADRGRERENIAAKYSLVPRDIDTNRRPASRLARATGNIINPARIDRDSVREIAFAGLFGGHAGAEFGPIGSAVSTAGSLAGAGIGAAVSPGGALIGATVAEKAMEGLFYAASKLVDVFKSISEAGLQYEESVLSISSSLQGFSQIVDNAGNPLPLSDQLGFQEERARDIQTKARKRLLPLGVGGAKESGIVGGVISSLVQKGISDFSDEDVEDLSAKVSALIQSQIPFLPAGRARLETEDLFLRPGRNTLLNQASRAFVSGDIEGASTIEEVKRALAGTVPLEEALVKNTNNAQQALNLFNAELSDLQTRAGSEFLRALVPALQEFTSALSSESFKQDLIDVARLFGNLGSVIVHFVAQVSQAIGSLTGEFGKGASKRGVFGQSLDNNLRRLPFGNNIADFVDNNELARGVGIGINEALQGRNPFQVVGAALTNNATKGLFAGFGEPAGADKPKPRRPGRVQNRAIFQINNLLDEEQTGKGSPLGNIVRSGLVNALIPTARAQKTDEATLVQSQLKASGLRFAGLEGLRTAIATPNTPAGQLAQANLDTRIFSEQAKEQGVAVGLRKGERDKALKQLEGAKNINQFISFSTKLGEATGKLIQEEQKLADVRNKASDAVLKGIDAFEKQLQEAKSGTDSFTLAGQRQGGRLDQLAINAERSFLQSRKETLDPTRFRLLNSQLDVRQKERNRAKELQPIKEAEIFNDAQKSVFDFTRLQNDLNVKIKGYANAVTEAQKSALDASNALKDFKSGTRLRELGRKGELLSLADASAALAAENGGGFAAVPEGIDPSLIKGSSTFSQESRTQFEQDLIFERIREAQNKNNFFRVKEEEALQQKSLEEKAGLGPLTVQQAKDNLAGARFEGIGQQLGLLQQLTTLKQQLPPGSKIFDRLSSTISESGGLSGIFKDNKEFKDFQTKLDEQSKVDNPFQLLLEQSAQIANLLDQYLANISNQLERIITGLGGSASAGGAIPGGAGAAVPSTNSLLNTPAKDPNADPFSLIRPKAPGEPTQVRSAFDDVKDLFFGKKKAPGDPYQKDPTPGAPDYAHGDTREPTKVKSAYEDILRMFSPGDLKVGKVGEIQFKDRAAMDKMNSVPLHERIAFHKKFVESQGFVRSPDGMFEPGRDLYIKPQVPGPSNTPLPFDTYDAGYNKKTYKEKLGVARQRVDDENLFAARQRAKGVAPAKVGGGLATDLANAFSKDRLPLSRSANEDVKDIFFPGYSTTSREVDDPFAGLAAGTLGAISGTKPISGRFNPSGANVALAGDILKGLVPATHYNHPKANVVSNPGTVGADASGLANTLKDMAKIVPPPISKAAGAMAGASDVGQLLQAVQQLKSVMESAPEKTGQQFKSALNSSFAGSP